MKELNLVAVPQSSIAPSSKSPSLAIANPASILPPAFSIRTNEDDASIVELAETVKQMGVVQPVIVRRTASGIEQVAGGRRLTAAKQAAATSVPILLYDQVTDAEAFEIQLIENYHRRDLTDYEQGRALKYALDRFKDVYPDQGTLAKRLGRTQQWVSLHIKAYETVEDLKKDTGTTRVVSDRELEVMSEYQLRELRSAPPEKRLEILEKLKTEPVAHPRRSPSARRIHAKVEHKHAKPTAIFCPVCSETLTLVHYSTRRHVLERKPRPST
jgi:ParB/RepB/Spo0J family partition protein